MVQDIIGDKILNSGFVNTQTQVTKLPLFLALWLDAPFLTFQSFISFISWVKKPRERAASCNHTCAIYEVTFRVSNKLAHSTVLSLCVLNYSKCLKYSRKDRNLPAMRQVCSLRCFLWFWLKWETVPNCSVPLKQGSSCNPAHTFPWGICFWPSDWLPRFSQCHRKVFLNSRYVWHMKPTVAEKLSSSVSSWIKMF